MEQLKSIASWLLEKSRPLVVKLVTRAVGYGLTAWFGVAAATATDESSKAANAVYAAVAFLAMAALDRWQHKTDKAEVPPASKP